MAVRTQRMGANPRAEVARSHTLASVGAKGRTGSVHLNQNGKKRSSGNVFRRLGQDTDMRDTLKRRRDQEWSQQSTAHNRHPEVTPMGQGEILIEDFYRTIATMKENYLELIAPITGSPFNLEIRQARLLEVKLSTIKAYEGKSDPQDHLDHFNDLMELYLVFELTRCRVFAVILTAGAEKWFKAIPARIISSWQQLSTSFLQHF